MLSSLFTGHAISRRSAFVAVIAAALACMVSAPAHAVVGTAVTPGTTVTPLAIASLPAGSTLVANSAGTIGSVGASAVVSTLWQAVYQEPGGTLDFLFQIRNDGTVNIDSFITADYGHGGGEFDTSVARLTGTAPTGFPGPGNGTVVPTSSSRTVSGSSVTFEGFVLAPGQTSQIFVVSTNALGFNKLGNAQVSGQVINGNNPGADTFLNTNEPSTTPLVPEPASLVSGSIALLAGLGCFGWRRLKASQA